MSPIATVESARAMQERGRHLMAVGRPREARRVLRMALATLASDEQSRAEAELRARVHITLANAEFELLGPAAGDARLKIAAAAIVEHDLAVLRVSLQNQRGLFALRSGRFEQALAEFDKALPFDVDAAANERCYLRLNRAVAQMQLGDLHAARRDLEACARDARENRLALVEQMAIHNIGYVEFLGGNLPAAARLMDDAIARDPSASPGVALLAKAQVLTEAGLHREADDVLAQAVAIFARDQLRQDLGETYVERARCALALDDADSAARWGRQARALFTRRDSVAWRWTADLIVLSASVGGPRGLTQHLRRAEQLADDFRDRGLALHAFNAQLLAVEAHLTAGHADAAAGLFTRIGSAPRGTTITSRMHASDLAARIDVARGQRSRAVRRVGRALLELSDYQATFGSIDLRTAAAVHGRRLRELDISLALETGRPASVFAAAERARAVSSRLPPVRPPADPESAALLAELRQLVESLREVEADPKASAELLRKRRDLERRIIARGWTVSGTGASGQAVPLPEVRAALATHDRSMISYVQSGTELAAVTVAGRVRLHHLGALDAIIERVRRVRADLDVVAQPHLPDGIRAAVAASLQRGLEELDAAIVRPLKLTGRLVVLSTGVLGHVPWNLLPSLRGVPVEIAPSATRWLSATQEPQATDLTVAAIAGPDLPRAEEEISAVATSWPKADAATGADATSERFVAALADSTVLHVAAHGVHQPENPLFSFVRMSDGPVFAHELDQTATTPEHVVLSACEVGLATIRPGDEALGLASVLLHLGTRSVVAGLARVPDDLAADAMSAYHQRLAGGVDSAAALAEVAADADRPLPFGCFGSSWQAFIPVG